MELFTQKKRASITIEAAVVCTLSIVLLSAFLWFFIVLQKEFQLKQNMYFVQQQKMLWEVEEENPTEYVDYVFIPIWGIGRNVLVENRIKNYGFRGYNDEAIIEERYVYVTEYGTVYHRTLSCSHLNIRIMAVTVKEISEKRNESGGKYYPCEYCGEGLKNGFYYITEHGNRYHSKKDCGSLLRNIKKVSIEEIEHLEACRDCWS